MIMGRVQDKTALVTGAASGIGRAIALMLAKHGAQVVVTDLTEGAAREVVDEIISEGGKAFFEPLNVSDSAQWAEVTAAVKARCGGLDILVNNAGITERGDAESIALSDWNAVINVNLNGVFLGTQAAIDIMKDTGGGSIINIASIEGMIGDANLSAYTASKGGVRSFTKSAALLCAEKGYGIRVNAINPGVIRTALLNDHLASFDDPEQETQRLIDQHPIGFLGSPDDVAYGVVYLACDESRFVTGADLVIDGGYTAQ
ncbi:MAG: glucose 1-dehydrogenase [Halioglobus sp.]|nr:glucose 1-dehydrogenase [Halioglobus sp.]